jgi:chromosome segregation ATPase
VYKTQFEILQKIEKLYSDIVRITAQIDLDNEEYEQILRQREELLNEVAQLQKQRAGLELGASQAQISEVEQKIQALILAALSDSEVLIEKAKELHDSLKKEISGAQKSMQAAKAYAAHSNYRK